MPLIPRWSEPRWAPTLICPSCPSAGRHWATGWPACRCGGPSPAPLLREEGMFDLRRARLDNGLRVWVKPRPGTATVVLLLQVPVGSRSETKANNGISHFLEHMLFTGTARWSEEEVVEVIRRRG